VRGVSQKGLSARRVSRGRRHPRRSSHPPRLPQRREPPPRDGGGRCWTVRASTPRWRRRRRRNVPPRARLVPRRPLFLHLALSPDGSALAARAHICMPVSLSLLCPPHSSLALSLSLSIAFVPSPPFSHKLTSVSILLICLAPSLAMCAARSSAHRAKRFSLSLFLSLFFFFVHVLRMTRASECICTM